MVMAKVPPAFRARCEASWIARPSAMGSVKGMPSSMMSAPAAGMPFSNSWLVARSGSQAVMKVTRPARFSAFSLAKRAGRRLMSQASRRGIAHGLGHGVDVFVATARQTDHHDMILAQVFGDGLGISDGVG